NPDFARIRLYKIGKAPLNKIHRLIFVINAFAGGQWYLYSAAQIGHGVLKLRKKGFFHPHHIKLLQSLRNTYSTLHIKSTVAFNHQIYILANSLPYCGYTGE